MLSKKLNLEQYMEELTLEEEEKLRPEDIYNFYYLNYILSDPTERANLSGDVVSSSDFEVKLLRRKYLEAFRPIVQDQLKKYLSRGRIDARSFKENDINTANYQKLDRMMRATYRSDMTRRNINWENLTKNLAGLQEVSDSKRIMYFIDRINNTIHNTQEPMLIKFDNGSELIQALGDAHRLNPQQLKLKTSDLEFLKEETSIGKAYVFDLDDTLIKSDSMIKVMDQGKLIRTLTPTQFNKYKREGSQVYNFKDFDTLINPKHYKMWNMLENVDKRISRGKSDSTIYILTARPMAIIDELEQYFIKEGIKNISRDNIFAIGDKSSKGKNVSEVKREILEELKTRHDGQVTFFDDHPENIEAADKLGVKTRLVKEGKYEKMTLADIIRDYQGKTLIAFDTETTGLEPNNPNVQITEIAVIAVDDTGKELDRFHKKINLRNDSVRNSPIGGGKTVQDLLTKSGYDDKNTEFGDEKQVLKEFLEFINQYPNPVLLAHNLQFDMKQVNTAIKRFGLPPIKGETLDTMQFSRVFFVAVMNALEGIDDIEEVKKIKSIMIGAKGKLANTLEKLGEVFQVKNEHWHSGIDDTLQLIQIYPKFIQWFVDKIDKMNPEKFDKNLRIALKSKRGLDRWSRGKSSKEARTARRRMREETDEDSLVCEREIGKKTKKIIDDFITFVKNELSIKNIPQIVLQGARGDLKTTGVYHNGDNKIRLNTNKRALVDILRTIGHELVHHQQGENGRLNKEHPSIGGEIEDEANAKAGAFLKKFAKESGNDIYSDEINMLESLEGFIDQSLGELDVFI